MVRYGLLKRPDLDRALHVVNREGRRLGPVLRELGVIEAPRLEQALSLHIREMLVTTLAWADAFHSFEQEELPEPPREDLTLRSSTGELILELVRSISSIETVREGLGNVDQTVVPVPDPPFRLERITLTPADGYVFSRVDGKATARTIIEITPLPKEEVERSLLGLLCTGVIEYRRVDAQKSAFAEPGRPTASPPREAPAASRPLTPEFFEELERVHDTLEGKNHFQVLGLLRTASVAEVKEAYTRQMSRFPPEAVSMCPPDWREKLKTLHRRLDEARAALDTPEKRNAYETSLRKTTPVPSGRTRRADDPTATLAPGSAPSPPRTAADADSLARAVAAAETDLGEGRFRDATVALEAVLAMTEGALERRARLLLARAYQMSPEGGRKAEAELLRLVRLDAKDTDALFALAKFYQGAALPARARVMFQRVLELQPGHKAASAALDTHKEAQPAASGLLDRLRRHTG
jgi:hypothetical protein